MSYKTNKMAYYNGYYRGYRDSLRNRDSLRRRHIDAGAKAVRHSDGLREMAESVKAKCKQLIDYLKSIGVGGIIIRLLGVILAGVGAVFGAKKTAEIVTHSDRLLKASMQLDGEIEKVSGKLKSAGAKGLAAVKSLKVVAKTTEFFAKRARKKANEAQAGETDLGYYGEDALI